MSQSASIGGFDIYHMYYLERRKYPLKKRFMLALAALMVLAMSMSVLADSSSTTNTNTSTSSSNVTTNVDAARTATLGIASKDAVIIPTTVSTTELTTLNATAKTISSDAQMLCAADYTLVSGTVGAPITVAVAGVNAGDNIVIVHDGKNGIEIVPATTVSLNSVTFSLSDLSPVAIVKLPAGVSINGTTTSTSYTTSPKTGEE